MTLTTTTTPATLPRLPRLVAGVRALQRSRSEVQVGLEPRHAVVIENLPPALARILCSLDGRATAAALLERAGAAHAPRLRRVLDALATRGLLTDGGRSHIRRDFGLWPLRTGVPPDAFARRVRQTSIVVDGEGQLAVAVARLLAACGVGHVAAESAGRVTEADAGVGYPWHDVGRRRRDAIAAEVSRASPRTSTAPMPSGRGPDLLVLTDTLVLPPHRVDQLMGERQPHLPVRFRDGTGVVGPLVLPGRTSCLRCADLHRCDLDRSWPRVANQLIGRCGHADPASVAAAAALAAGQILRAVQDGGERPPLWNATLELDVVSAAVTRRTWLPHPRCTCDAPLG